MSPANGDGGGLRTYSRIPLHLRGKTPGAADGVKDSNTGNSSNIANRDKISTDARFVQMVHAIVGPSDIYGGTNRTYRNYNNFICKLNSPGLATLIRIGQLQLHY